jgi:hypothetical protein
MIKDKLRPLIKCVKEEMSVTQTSLLLGTSKATISRLYKRVMENIALFESLDQMSDSELANLVYYYPNKAEKYIDLEHITESLKEPNVNLELLFSEHQRKYGEDFISRATFYKFCSDNHAKDTKPRMSLSYKPGELAQVDWAGDKLKYYEGGKERRAHVLIVLLPYSGIFYVEPFRDEKMGSWIEGHINAFRFLGGVPRLIRPDNLKVGVTTPDKYAPLLNEQYREFCQHYNIIISPARVASPRDKATVENIVGFVYTWVFGYLRNDIINSYEELKIKVREALVNALNREVRGRHNTRFGLFELEKPYLQSLPSVSFELYNTKIVTIMNNYHIQFDNHFYSVPHKFVNSKAKIKFNSTNIEIYVDGILVAEHIRSYSKDHKDKYITLEKHKPRNHIFYDQLTSENLLSKALEIGHATASLVTNIIQKEHKSSQSLNICDYLLKLANKYDPLEIEATSRYIVVNGITPSISIFINILNNKLYQ